MPIYVGIDADPESCHTCAAALERLAGGVDEESNTFRDAHASSQSNWRGDTGDRFRERITALEKASGGLADKTRDVAKALREFADQLDTAKVRMVQAAAIAMEAGLYAGPNPCDPEWIGDPIRATAIGPMIPAQEAAYAKQVAAYSEALAMAGEGRRTEMDAHVRLREAMLEKRGLLSAVKSEFVGEAPWLAANLATGYVQGVVAKQAPWDEAAETMTAQAKRFRAIASESLPDAVRAAAANAAERFGLAADDAVRAAANTPYNKMLPGGANAREWQLLSTTLVKEGSDFRFAAVGSKIPVAGVVLTALQTGVEVLGAEDKGDAALAIGKNIAGFAAGTIATELMLASVAGGPATVAVVGAGVLIGWGVSEAIEWAGGE